MVRQWTCHGFNGPILCFQSVSYRAAPGFLQGLSHVQARDEAIMQLLRHTRTSQNPIPEHLERHVNTWELFLLVASTMPPLEGVPTPGQHQYVGRCLG